ncbi:flagellar basal body P-ring formation chaperone FlgA [Roseibium sediminicola]|uniref:Flagellar basal body P-ring formation chaperone FlgA n=1 Tax=Roseibium sediminicola TaxID=2933272 RepID=A0ABT0GZK3_9HYPH|nr:flagellar basal body P-ring formation chaperone FlgA [Roseibium sp. CAU 1639]MCK7614869.1 flagellar basal body P-ring formation chaperone FlgA [Roseibium sp. CAU 1639]
MMKQLLKAAFGLLLIGLATAPSRAEERPVLRSQVMTLSDIVTVGDFYTNAGRFAAKPLFRSPDMGTSGNVPASDVAERARAAGLETAGTDGLRTVVVYRGATKLNRDQLAGLVRKSLEERNAGLNADKLDIRLLQAPDQVLADPKVSDPIRIDRVEWSQTSGHFTLHATVAVEFGTDRLILSGIATEMIDVVTLAQPVRRGDIVKEEDLDMLRIARNKVPAGALTDLDDIVGKQARINVRANAPLSRRDFQRPVLIERGEKITVTFIMPGMKLTSRAQAMDDGAKGDVIDVMNLTSRRIVPAIVTSRGQVRVHAANPIVASLNSETQ